MQQSICSQGYLKTDTQVSQLLPVKLSLIRSTQTFEDLLEHSRRYCNQKYEKWKIQKNKRRSHADPEKSCRFIRDVSVMFLVNSDATRRISFVLIPLSDSPEMKPSGTF